MQFRQYVTIFEENGKYEPKFAFCPEIQEKTIEQASLVGARLVSKGEVYDLVQLTELNKFLECT